jgi:trk system potassium uptake protein
MNVKIVIVGCGRIGADLAMRLSAAKHFVTVIDPKREAFDRLGEDFLGRTIDGVGFDRGVLIRAGIESADAIAAVTSDDSSNVIIARIARNRFKVPRVVARLYDPRHTNLYQVLNIPTASTVAWGVDRLEHLLCHSDMEEVLCVGNGNVRIVELHIPPGFAGQPVGSLQVMGEVTVAALIRAGESSMPGPDTLLQVGDILLLGVLKRALAGLQARLDQYGKSA